MKKTTYRITLFCLAGILLLFSFKTEAQVQYGIKAGAGFSELSYKDNGAGRTSGFISGFKGGAFVNLPVSPLFFIQPSLMYERKGGRLTSDVGGLKTDGNMRLDYLTLPVDLAISLKKQGSHAKWIIGAGPYFGYGLYGSAVSSASIVVYSDNPFENNSIVGGASLKRFDAGAHVQIDYEMHDNLNIGINAELGLTNLAANKAGDYPVHNNTFGVTAGYTFKKL